MDINANARGAGADLDMVSRRYTFQLEKALAGNWNQGDQFKTILVNAISFPLPSGEKLFIKAVRYFIDQITDPQLKKWVGVFFKQESAHTREHVTYNKLIGEYRNYNIALLEAPYRKYNEHISEHTSPVSLLATTVCMEHLTAITSHLAITDERWMGRAKSAVKDFWWWHSLEEIEHKAVAFDVYMNVCGDRALLNQTMSNIVGKLGNNLKYTMCQMYMMEGGKPRDIKAWLENSDFLNADDGLLKAMGGYIDDFYREDFHPWDHDNSHLIALVSKHLDSVLA
jgi:hypothetical protein